MQPIRPSCVTFMLTSTLLLSHSVVAAPPTADAVRGAEFVKNLTALISSEYLYKTPSEKLFDGALNGLSGVLKTKKLPALKLAKIRSKGEFEKAAQEFTADFYKVAARHPKLVTDDSLQVAAVRGMLKTLDDPYTVYMDKKEFQSLKEAMNGTKFGGLGIYIQLDKDNKNALTIIEPMADTPAMRGGLRSRDVILQINDTPTVTTTINQAQTLLRGEIGSKVRLLIKRSQQEPFWVEIVRDEIRTSSVNSKLLEQDSVKVGYIKLKVFGENTNNEMESAIRTLEEQGAQAYILDLRNNGGGYINAAVDVCSKFLNTGSRVVSVAERGLAELPYSSHPNLHPVKPLVLLVNEYSASASEITAGAMQDLARAKLVGNKTFGKGSVQKIFPLADGAAMKVTTAHYRTPEGKDIHKLGIQPDIKVAMDIQKVGTADDAQFKTAVDAVVSEVKALPAAVIPGPMVAATVDDELKIIAQEKSQGYAITKREFVREQDRLFEDITLEKAGEIRKLRLELQFLK